MIPVCRYTVVIAAVLACVVFGGNSASANTIQFCVKCTGPAQTYICNVETTATVRSGKGLQLFCIIQTSREGGHRSCSVAGDDASTCTGPVKTYRFNPPKIPEKARQAIQALRKPNDAQPNSPTVPPQRGGEPETLIDLTKGAVGASRKGLKNTGAAVGTAAGTTTHTVGKAARGVGKGVVAAASKVGSATKKTGGAVGGAAKSAWDCIKSLFKNCGNSE